MKQALQLAAIIGIVIGAVWCLIDMSPVPHQSPYDKTWDVLDQEYNDLQRKYQYFAALEIRYAEDGLLLHSQALLDSSHYYHAKCDGLDDAMCTNLQFRMAQTHNPHESNK
jgi:hypothetical protein